MLITAARQLVEEGHHDKNLTVEEVATVLRRHPRTVYRWISAKKVRVHRTGPYGNRVLIPCDEARRLLHASESARQAV